MILVDRPRWPRADGMRFAHLMSDASFDELHAFASALDLPRPLRFHRDHYDVPEAVWPDVIARGARVVSTKELIRRTRRGRAG